MSYPVTLSGFYQKRRHEVLRVCAHSRSLIATSIICFLSVVSSPIALLQYFCTRGGTAKSDKVYVEVFQLVVLSFNFLVLFYLLNCSQYWFFVSLCRIFDLLYILRSLVFVPHKFYRIGRALLLLLLEYLEIVVIFAVAYLHLQTVSPVPIFSVGGCPRSLHPAEAFFFSLGTFATFGAGDITLRLDVATALPIRQNPLLYVGWQALCIVVVVIYVVLRISNASGRAK